MMGITSVWHWIVVLVVVLLVFGTGKLRNVGSDLGHAIRDFKKSMNDGEREAQSTSVATPADPASPAGGTDHKA